MQRDDTLLRLLNGKITADVFFLEINIFDLKHGVWKIGRRCSFIEPEIHTIRFNTQLKASKAINKKGIIKT